MSLTIKKCILISDIDKQAYCSSHPLPQGYEVAFIRLRDFYEEILVWVHQRVTFTAAP